MGRQLLREEASSWLAPDAECLAEVDERGRKLVVAVLENPGSACLGMLLLWMWRVSVFWEHVGCSSDTNA